MKFRRSAVIVIFVFAINLAAHSGAAAKDEWVRVQTANFELVGNAGEKELRRVATKFEQFRFVFKSLFTKMKFNSPIPTRVVVFKDEKSFKFFKTAEWVAGYFQPGEDVNYIVLSTEGEKADTYRVIFHEYTHFLIDNSLGRSNIPPWFNEGIAEYYEQFKIEDDQKVTLGGLNDEHLFLLAGNKLIRFETFFNIDYYSLKRQTKQSAGLFYAQSWAFLHFLMQGNNRARVTQMGQFLELLLQGKQPKFAFEQAFQTDYQTMENELRAYIGQRKFMISVANFKEKLVFDREMQISALTLAETKAIQGDLLFHTHRPAEAEKYLNEALALNPDLSLANSTLGLVKMRQKQFSDAKKYLEKAIQTDAKNYLAFYSYAFALSREEMTEFGFSSGFSSTQAEKIRENLEKAIALNPNFAESYNLLAFVNIVRNEQIVESIEFIKKALDIAPGNQWYQMRLAELYMRGENFEAARKIVQKLVLSAGDDRLKVYAENTLTRINSLESQLASMKDRRKRETDGITDKPLGDEELARRREKAMLESLNRALRLPGENEERILGTVTLVDCRAKEIIVSVKTDGLVKQFRTASLDDLILTSFENELADTPFGCGVQAKQGLAVVTFRPTSNPKTKIQGEIVAIEFVPKTFRFLEK